MRCVRISGKSARLRNWPQWPACPAEPFSGSFSPSSARPPAPWRAISVSTMPAVSCCRALPVQRSWTSPRVPVFRIVDASRSNIAGVTARQPSQTLKRQAFFLAALGSPRSSFVPSGGWPTIALCKIDTAPEHFEIAANISEDLTSALTRAGISVVSEARSARYQLIGAIRGTGRQTRLVFRMIDRGSGRQLWAHRTDGALVDAAEKQLATRIAAALQPCLRLAEVDHALRKP